MAGTMVHLLTAEKLYQKLTERTWTYPFDKTLRLSKDYFIAGNICPDGIMARKGYERSMKLHTHFRDDIPDGTFEADGNIEKFEARMKNFWHSHEKEETLFPGLYLGYITHMMTDEKFILEERPKFFQEIAKTGLTIYDRETYIHFNEDTDLIDFRLAAEKEELQNAKKLLENISPYEIIGMITTEELTDSRNWILQHFFYEKHPEKEAKFLKYPNMLHFIETVTEEITERLFKENYLCPS